MSSFQRPPRTPATAPDHGHDPAWSVSCCQQPRCHSARTACLVALALSTGLTLPACWSSGGCDGPTRCVGDELHECAGDLDTGHTELITDCSDNGRVCRRGNAPSPVCSRTGRAPPTPAPAVRSSTARRWSWWGRPSIARATSRVGAAMSTAPLGPAAIQTSTAPRRSTAHSAAATGSACTSAARADRTRSTAMAAAFPRARCARRRRPARRTCNRSLAHGRAGPAPGEDGTKRDPDHAQTTAAPTTFGDLSRRG